jgi:cytochrome P450
MVFRLNHEFMLYLINQPTLLLFAEAIRGANCLDIPYLGYFINDGRLAQEILLHPNFTSAGPGGMGTLISPIVGEYGLFNMDGENHSNFKQALLRVFTRDYAKRAIEIAGAKLLQDLAAQLSLEETVDMVTFTRQFTCSVMLYIFGVDLNCINIHELEPLFSDAVTYYMSRLHLRKISLNDVEISTVFQKTRALDVLIENNQRTEQSDSLLHALLAMGLSKREAFGLLYALLVAGTETVNVTLPRILALLLDSKQFQTLKENPSLMNSAIEEGIRVTTASPMIPRAIAANTQLRNYHFKAGRRIHILVYNIMKQDYDLNAARRFDIQRSIPQSLKHLNFGHGTHFCLGFPLAYGEIETALNCLLSLKNSPRIVSRGYSHGKTFPAYTRLVIRA